MIVLFVYSLMTFFFFYKKGYYELQSMLWNIVIYFEENKINCISQYWVWLSFNFVTIQKLSMKLLIYFIVFWINKKLLQSFFEYQHFFNNIFFDHYHKIIWLMNMVPENTLTIIWDSPPKMLKTILFQIFSHKFKFCAKEETL